MNADARWTDRPTTEDQLGFKDYIKTLVDVIWQADTPITIGIFGTWGSGKTSLMGMVRKNLQDGKAGRPPAKTVWFDAWKYDKEDVLWRTLILSALGSFRPKPPDDRELSKEEKDLSQKLDDLQASLYRDVDREESGPLEINWGSAAKGTLKFGLSFLPLFPALAEGFIRQIGGSKPADTTGAPKDAIGDLVDAVRRKRSKIHWDRVEFLDQFQTRFSDLVKDHVAEDSRFVVFIDDLDRCLPEKAVEVLEAIKLFLEAERCIFVVGVDQRVIEQGIRVKYQSLGFEEGKKNIPITGEEYLEKIVQIPFFLPPLELASISDFAFKRLEGDFEKPVADVLARGMEANPRKIKRVLNIFRLLWTLAGNRKMDVVADLLAKMVVIQNRWRDLYLDVIQYPNLLGNLEDRFEQIQRETEYPGPPPELREKAPGGEASSSREDVQSPGPEKPWQKTLVEKYADRKPLQDMLLTPGTTRFKDIEDPKPYIYLTTTVVQKRDQEEREVSVDTHIWTDLMSNDPTRIEAAIGRIEKPQQGGYVKRLLGMISDQKANDLQTRIAAGNALGMLGDPRLTEMEMIPIPAGPFKMGTEGEGGSDNEKPQREVSLNAYEISKYPLTNVQYKAFLDANSGHSEPRGWSNRTYPLGKANHPVVNISYDDAQAYAEWLSKEKGKKYHLLTEAEWEKAARGDKDAREYPWGDEFDPGKCNTGEGGVEGTTPVGIYPDGVSTYGVMDMVGNVWEWCADWYGVDYYKSGENHNPQGPKKGVARVVRGGSWNNPRDVARCAFRFRDPPGARYDFAGVRFSRTP